MGARDTEAEGRQPRQPARSSSFVLEGLAAGLLIAAADGLALGAPAARWPTLLSIAAFGSLVGLLAGGAGALAGRRGVAAGLALGGALGVHLVSMANRELDGLGFLIAAALLAALFGLAGGRLFARAAEGRWAALASLAALVALPPMSWWMLASGELATPPAPALLPLAFALAAGLPLALALLARSLARRASSGAGRGWRIACGAALLVVGAGPPALERLADGSGPARSRAPAALAPPPAAPHPSVVMIVVDSLRADHVGRGDTPFLDSLAREGVRCTQAVSVASWTLPAVASLLTGTYPGEHGAVETASRLHERFETLAEMLRAHGYQTAAFTGGGFLVPETGLDRGFETFEAESGLNIWWRIHTPLFWRVAKNRYLPLRPVVRFVYDGSLARMERRVARWLEERDRARPFFLFLHTYEVHDYHIYHPDPDDFLEPSAPRPSARFRGRSVVPPEEILAHGTAEDIAAYHALYVHRLRFTDRALASIMARIEAQVAGQELVTLFTSDHGEGFEHELRRLHHGGRLHDDLLLVPLILRAPGRLPRGVQLDAQVSLLDVVPTVLDLCGLAAGEGLRGRSLAQGLAGHEPWRLEAFAEDSLAERKVAVRRADWKLILGRDAEEAYHLAVDAAELRSRPTEIPLELRSLVQAYLAVHSAGLEDAPRAEFDSSTLRHLRALGYTE